MKRAFIITVLLFYTFAASGASVHLHFCEELLIDYSVLGSDHDGCCCEEKEKCIPNDIGFSKPCCVDHIASAKINDDQDAKAGSTFNVNPVACCNFYFDNKSSLHNFVQHVSPVSNPPPLPGRCEVFLFVRSIRI